MSIVWGAIESSMSNVFGLILAITVYNGMLLYEAMNDCGEHASGQAQCLNCADGFYNRIDGDELSYVN